MSKGIDNIIDDLVKIFEQRLWKAFDCKFYGRTYRIPVTDAQFSPAIHDQNNDYIEVLYDDKKAAMCFFDVMPNSKTTGAMYENKCRVFFMVDLSTIYAGYSRNDATETAREQVSNILSSRVSSVDNFESGETSFKEFYWDKAKLANMHPYFLFRIDFTNYNTIC